MIQHMVEQMVSEKCKSNDQEPLSARLEDKNNSIYRITQLCSTSRSSSKEEWYSLTLIVNPVHEDGEGIEHIRVPKYLHVLSLIEGALVHNEERILDLDPVLPIETVGVEVHLDGDVPELESPAGKLKLP